MTKPRSSVIGHLVYLSTFGHITSDFPTTSCSKHLRQTYESMEAFSGTCYHLPRILRSKLHICHTGGHFLKDTMFFKIRFVNYIGHLRRKCHYAPPRLIFLDNKKVLLRERKRHTDRGVSSTTRWGTPSPCQGTPPGPGLTGGYPRYPPAGPGSGTPLAGHGSGTPLAKPGSGTPWLDLARVPPPPQVGID